MYEVRAETRAAFNVLISVCIFRMPLNKCCWFLSLFFSLFLPFPLSFSLISLAYCVYYDGNSWRIAWNKCQLTRGVLVLSHNTAAARILRVEMRLAFCQNEKIRFMNERPPLFVGYKPQNWLWDQTSIVRLKLFQRYIKSCRALQSTTMTLPACLNIWTSRSFPHKSEGIVLQIAEGNIGVQ